MRRLMKLIAVAALAASGAISPLAAGADSNTPNSWTTDTARPGPQQEGLTAAAVGSTIFVLGGNDVTPGGGACRNDAYDVATDSWSSAASPLQCVVEPGGAASTGGLVYLISGICRGNIVATCTPETDTPALQIYDPTTNTWSFGAPIPHPRSRAGVAVHGGKIYVIGGYLYSNGVTAGPFDFVDIYDIPTNTWTTGAPMPTKREGLLAATVGNKIFAIGGLTVARNTLFPTGVVERYDIGTDSWTMGFAPMPTPRGIVFGGVACGSDPIFVIGGASVLASAKNEAYIASHDRWITRADMPAPRAEAGAAVVGQEIHAIGGFSVIEGTGDTNLNQAYHCPSGASGHLKSSTTGAGIAGLTVSLLSSTGTLLSGVVSLDAGYYYVDAPGPGTYALTVTTATGTTTTTVNIPAGTIVLQDLTI